MACPRCHKRSVRVVSGRTIALPMGPPMPTCRHVACVACWKECAEAQLPGCRADGRLRPSCCSHGCREAIAPGVWSWLCAGSEALSTFDREKKAEAARLQRLDSKIYSLAWAESPSEPGPVCPVCCERRPAIVTSRDCGHAACEDCWASWAEAQLEDCRAEWRLRPRCVGEDCHHAVSFGAAATKSQALSAFYGDRDAEVARLRRTARDLLVWAPLPTEPGPVCSICGEQRLALLRNRCCGAAACEDCWSRWAEAQLPRCRGARDVVFLCLGVGCQQPAAAVWAHACTVSQDVRSLDTVLARRKRIEQNALYPSEMQVDCPRAECLGLGYLGFGTVMCFMCEHQWAAGDGDPPHEGVGEEFMAGELMKRCPGCSEYIVKNGGCDHMTCRCGHEFWWSSLLPYRSGSR